MAIPIVPRSWRDDGYRAQERAPPSWTAVAGRREEPVTASASNSRSSAAALNARMLATRSLLPVSSVIARSVAPGHRDAAVAGGVAVAVAGRAGGAALRQGPARGEALPRGLRQQPRIRLGRGAHAERRYVGEVEQRPARYLGIDNGAAEEIGRRAGQRQQRRRDQAAGRGFRHHDGLAARPSGGGATFSARGIKSCIGARSPAFALHDWRMARACSPRRAAPMMPRRARKQEHRMAGVGIVLLFGLALFAPAALGQTYPDRSDPADLAQPGRRRQRHHRAHHRGENVHHPRRLLSSSTTAAAPAARSAPRRSRARRPTATRCWRARSPRIRSRRWCRPSSAYDPIKDFEPISLLALVQNVLVVTPTLPVANVADLDRARQGAAGQAQLRVRRSRLDQPFRGRHVRRARRHPE